MIEVTVSWLQIDTLPPALPASESGAGSSRKRRATRRPALQIIKATSRPRSQREREFAVML